jgi:hypothetical protein
MHEDPGRFSSRVVVIMIVSREFKEGLSRDGDVQVGWDLLYLLINSFLLVLLKIKPKHALSKDIISREIKRSIHFNESFKLGRVL